MTKVSYVHRFQECTKSSWYVNHTKKRIKSTSDVRSLAQEQYHRLCGLFMSVCE